jgi:hypothetical protein
MAAMQSATYRAMRSANMKRITASANWRASIDEYKLSGEAKRRCANRQLPKLPNWQIYIGADGRVHRFRSTWEVALARYLDVLRLAWTFEPRRFVFEDGASYTPDFRVTSPFGLCYLESHRLERIRPGDEEKVARLHHIADNGLLDAPLILLGETEMIHILRLVGVRRSSGAAAALSCGRSGNVVSDPASEAKRSV